MRRTGGHASRGYATLVASIALACLVSAAPAAALSSAPDPGGDENADIALPLAGKQFGFSERFAAGDPIDPTVKARLIRQAGGTVARLTLQWWGMERTRDVWNEATWARHAAVYTALRDQGITPELVLVSAPPWARDAGDAQSCMDTSYCTYPPAPDMLGEWKEFVAEVARRFPQATIEIWNEPNFVSNWRSGVDPERYAQLLSAAYDAAKSVRPSIRVLNGGLGGSIKPGGIALREFLARAYAASPSLKGHTDAINFHAYMGAQLGQGTLFANLFQDVRQVRAAYGDEATPLFVSESGVSTSGPDPVSEADQADIVMRTTRKVLTMPDVDGILVHALTDNPNYPADDMEYGFGLMRYATAMPLEPKRAYCQLTRAAVDLYSQCPPLAIIDSGPSGITNQASPEFRFSATEAGATFECSLDSAAFSACSSPKRYVELAEGPHTFAVRAFDSSGRTDPDPVEREFEIDVTPPDTELTGPSGPTQDTSPSYRLASPDADARFECSLNGGRFQPCSSPHELGPLADGSYSLQARAVDPAGNTDPSPGSISLRVDTRPPLTTITSGPSGPTTDTKPRFEFSSDESSSTFQCSFDGNSFGSCNGTGSHTAWWGLAEGSHRFNVRAVDAAGNRGPTITRSFEIDLTGPQIALTGPPTPTSDATPAFDLQANEGGVTFECRLDGATYAPCTSPHTVSALSDGYHELQARGIDGLGNRGPAVRYGFTVDTDLPGTVINLAPPSLVGTSSVTFGFYSESGARLECSLDGSAFAGCTSPYQLNGLSDGPHTFRVRGVDRAGNVDPDPAERTFTVDTRAPAASVDSGPDGPTRQTTPAFIFSADESPATFECRLDGAAFGPCSGAQSHSVSDPLPEGQHVFEVRARDRVGNLGAAASRSFTVDLTPPAAPRITVSYARGGLWVKSPDVSFAITPPEPGVSFSCRLDGADRVPCGTSPSFQDISEGSHVLSARVLDAAGNVSEPGSATVIVDLTPPDTRIGGGASSGRAKLARFNFTASESGATFRCKVDRRRYKRCSAPYKPRRLESGRHRLRVRAVDRAGNGDRSPATSRFRIKR